MEGGVGWWKQITDALDRVQFLVIVMTPASLQSETTRKEWRYARQQGVCVCPVKGRPDEELDYGSVPNWMRKAHFYDLDKEWDTFVNYLKRPCQANRVPFMAPDLPAGFVQRRGPLGSLCSLVLDANRENAVPITTALHGPGGLGKTTIAAALCHEDDVITAFDDGILWVTLGQKPNLVGELTKFYAAITGERPGFVDAEDAAVQLASRLEDKTCLMVLDDVWDAAHLRLLRRGGRGCARVITTRQFECAREFACVKVDEMQIGEAVEMLTADLKPDPLERAGFEALADRLGEWPLLLKLTTGILRERLQRGDTIDGALQYVNRALDKRGLTAFDKAQPTDRREAVKSTLDVSLELLSQDQRRRCVELAVLPEDAHVPLSIIRQLWGLDAFDTEELVQLLADFSLVDLDLRVGVVRMHDVIRAYLQREVSGERALHARLVEAWGDPRRLPNEYAWRWYAYHSMQAGRQDALRQLLLDFDWIRAKLDATGANPLIADYEYFPEDESLHEVQGALRLSAHILAKDPSQLPSQLYGRLAGTGDPGVKALVDGVPQREERAWLRPLTGALTVAGGPLVRILAGHSGRVTAVAVTPDGKRAVSASGDRTLKVWDLASGEEVLTLAGHSDRVTAVAVTPDGKLAVSAALDMTVKVWDLATGEERLTVSGRSTLATALAVTPDGKRVLSAAGGHTINVWDLMTGKQHLTLAGHAYPVAAVAVTPDGRFAVSGSLDKTVKVWDLATGEAKLTVSGRSTLATAVTVTPDGQSFVSPAADHTLLVRDLMTGESRLTLTGHSDVVTSVVIVPDGKHAISGSWDNTLKVWNLTTGEAELTLSGHSDLVSAVAVTPDGKRAVSGSGDYTLRVWNLSSREENITRAGHADRVTAVALTSDGKHCVSASADRTLKLWDVLSGEPTRSFGAHAERITAVALTPDGQTAVSGSWDHRLKVWDLATGEERLTFAGHSDRVTAVAVTPDGKRAVSGSFDRTLKVWDLTTGEEKLTLEGHSGRVTAVAVTPDGRLAVSASGDKTLKVWDLTTGNQKLTFVDRSAVLTAVAVTAHRKRVVSASRDHTLKVWDAATGEMVFRLEGHSGPIGDVAATPDCRLAVSVSWDRSVKVWDLAAGTLITGFCADGDLSACAVTSDGASIVVGAASGRLIFLRLENVPRRSRSR